VSALGDLGPPQWRGQPGRLEVWYATFTDEASGLGGWVHLETVAPTEGGAPHAHGWTAVFPADGPAVLDRFGPSPVVLAAPDAWCRVGRPDDARGWATVGPGGGTAGGAVLQGAAGSLAWDIQTTDTSTPLYTFPRTVWERHLLPAAQVVPQPSASVRGTVTVAGEARSVQGPGALARIYGHGSAQRWGWLHAPLGDGAALEIVTATARRAAMRRLPPLALVQLRLPGEPDWPGNPLLAAVRFRTTLRPDGFTVTGGIGGRRVTVEVDLPPDARVALGYTDPDGATATCTNSERATARITVTGRGGERHWALDGTAHAEVGTRP
jgi:hypothetical protein